MTDTNEPLTRLYDRVIDLTRKGKIPWKQRSRSGSGFAATFPRSSLELRRYRSIGSAGDSKSDRYELRLYDNSGIVVARYRDHEPSIKRQSVNDLLRPVGELFELVERHFRESLETAHELLEQLDRLEQAPSP